MSKYIHTSILALAVSLLFVASGFAAGQQDQKQMDQQQKQQQQQQQAQQQQQQGQSQYAQQLVTPDKLDGLTVQNQQGEEIGTVDKVVLDSQDGKIAYVVVTSGGFWGIGGEKAVIPWKAVQFQQQQQQLQAGQQGQQPVQMGQGEPMLVLDVTKDQLKNAPQGDIQQVLDRQQGQEIHQYYGVSPYWEEGQGQQQKQQPQQQQQQKQQKQY